MIIVSEPERCNHCGKVIERDKLTATDLIGMTIVVLLLIAGLHWSDEVSNWIMGK